jgi:uncharacterized protein involved in type VI secretion and phage assembly
MTQQYALDEQMDGRLSRGYGGRFYGVYPALVCEITDPEGQGRIKIKLPWSPDSDGNAYEAWARLATMMAGDNRGSWFVPDVNDEVLVVFEAGDTRRPYVIGSLWNGQDAPPKTMDSGGNNYQKTLVSRNGIRISMDDTDGVETLTLETPGGQKLVLKDGPGLIELKDSNGNSIKMEPAGITVNASAKVTINASTIEISAGMLTVNAGMSKFSGVVQADTVMATTVVGTSYTPGAGNIW